MQQAGNGGAGVVFAAEDGGHEDEGYLGDPLSSVFGGPESGHGPTAYVLQLQTSESRLFPHVMSTVFASKRLGATTVIGDSGASRHNFGDGTHVRNKRLPAAEEAYLIISDGERLPVACYGKLDLVLHCERNGKPWSNVRVTLKNVAAVPGMWFDHLLQPDPETHPILLDKEGEHILGGRVLFTKHVNGNYVQATKVAHHGSPSVRLNPGMPATTVPSATVPPAMAAAVLRPGASTSIDNNDLHASLGYAHEGNLRETAKDGNTADGSARTLLRMRGGEGNSSGCFVVHGAASDQAARASLRRSLRGYAGLYRRVGLLLLHRGLLLQLGVADLSEGQIRRHRHPRIPHLPGGHQAAAGEAREPGALRTGNGTEFVNDPFANLLAEHGIRREFTSVDGPKPTVAWSGGSPWLRKGLGQRGWGFRASSRTYGFPAGQCTTLPCGRRHRHGCQKTSTSLRAWTTRTRGSRKRSCTENACASSCCRS